MKASLHMLDHNIELVHTNTKVTEYITFADSHFDSQEAEGDEKAEVIVGFHIIIIIYPMS